MDENKKSENKFEVEMMRRIEHIILNLGDFNNRFDGLEQDVSEIKLDVKEISEIKSDVKILKGQFTDVVGMVLEDNKRITKLEKDVEDLQSNIH